MGWFRKDDYNSIFLNSPKQMQERIEALEARVRKLESDTNYPTDDYTLFLGQPKYASLAVVVRRIANHLGLQVLYKYPQDEGVEMTFANERTGTVLKTDGCTNAVWSNPTPMPKPKRKYTKRKAK